MLQVFALNCESVYPTWPITSRATEGKSMGTFVSNLAAIKTIEVATAHSATTRAWGSRLKIWSTKASLIWSHSLSGWPSVTDSDVKTKAFFTRHLVGSF